MTRDYFSVFWYNEKRSKQKFTINISASNSMKKIDFRKDGPKILIGFCIAATLVNGYFAISGNLPPPEFSGKLQLTIKIATFAVVLLLAIAVVLIYSTFLKEESRKISSVDVFKMVIGFFIALSLPSLKLKIYPLLGISLVFILIFTYLSFFRE